MLESIDTVSLVRNLSIYAVGVGLAAAGALGLAEAIELSSPIAAALFITGLVTVVAVHEYLGGPL
ncbi:hypothetical protein [Natronorubrum tibetense]|uniref:Uncharacterized protein n=1 Tax=Natronorubrum tibetense GA33 TaxID=1114856 RepID=L9W979_9EURY|nr:hypothetical protein [Natronorubrum tibetense]ELY45836.1 hypothetical protein C496_02802 [Natronorubrum tibetense GA33]